MTVRARAVCVAVACILWACNAAPPEPSVEPADPGADELPTPSVEAVLRPTPEMLQAALSGDAMQMAITIATASSCIAPSTCPAEYGACTNWSSFAECNFTCGPTLCFCNRTEDACQPPGPRGRTTSNSYRVCFDPAANACTEWQQSSSTFCGC
jgi:hypothetical protein